MSDLNELLITLRALTIVGGEAAMKHFGNLECVQRKSDESPVTAADIEVDGILVEGLTKAFPHIPIITEERAGNHDADFTKSQFFLVDPIDGTREFVDGKKDFTINIALIENGEPIAGAICAPARNVVYWGGFQTGAFKSAARQGSTAQKISAQNIGSKKFDILTSRSHQTAETTLFLETNNKGTVVKAGSSLKFCLMANGEAGLYPRMGPTMEWDVAAGHAILAAAGGTVSQLDSSPLTYGKPGYRNPWFIAKTPEANFVLPDKLMS